LPRKTTAAARATQKQCVKWRQPRGWTSASISAPTKPFLSMFGLHWPTLWNGLRNDWWFPHYLYPALLLTPPALQFTDQFAFRPTGSTTAAIISLLHTVINLLSTNSYVIVISLDFSKAFDTVRHSTLLKQLAHLDLSDYIYNWPVDFLTGHSHCTLFGDQTSGFESITASIIQGSAIEPAAYVVNAGDFKTITSGNLLCKFADDTCMYLIVPASNEASGSSELHNVQSLGARQQSLNSTMLSPVRLSLLIPNEGDSM